MTNRYLGRLSAAFGLLALLLATACSSPSDPPRADVPQFKAPVTSDLERIWQNAVVAVPVRGTTGSMVTTNRGRAGPPQGLAGVGPDIRWPIIVVVQACGLPDPLELMRAMAEQGYVVLSPASNSRFFNPLDCQSAASVHDRAEATLDERRLEIRYVLKQLSKQSWIDPANVFLVGLHDGAAAVARYTGQDVKARILAEWDCQGSGKVNGVAHAERSPIFAVTSARTPIFGGDCSRFFAPAEESVVLSMPQKYANNILLEPIVYTQFLRFLDRQLFK
ncbi:hypothetical protein [Sneathiella sp.]|jgi:dienelactone hydrolase|uniref:hypothetical protein n=1 Tax=Sneathiella sp. TaxID=1964365 RepID=UPI0039E3917D